MDNFVCLNKNYSTTRLVMQDKPETINALEDKFETVLYYGEKYEDQINYFLKPLSNKAIHSI